MALPKRSVCISDKNYSYWKTQAKEANKTLNEYFDSLRKLQKTHENLLIKLNEGYANILKTVYGTILPFVYGAVSTYFFVTKSYFFIPFAFLTLMPIIFRLEKIDHKTLAVIK